ncbi:hypothetical protein OCV51_11710 [Faecalicatena acetigenes]|uniref:Uncharacterized protein n=1 Tax=Faecalicatena acetigenes TaxID=2981790 RepID=A0ABT2TE84_9FIRM|nr:hypothetical protein [Faecalicatena acetigenes]MCU6748311.1 hypothetical protein [Faecalicatena acetigenes]SCI37448.1 Uncharacterised protein [uncultured Clostridium sp.]
MKRMKKLLLLALCAGILSTATACGSEKDADNGADQTEDRVNDATTGKDKEDKTDKGNGIVNDAVDDVTDGVNDVTEDITDGVDKAADDMTENNGADKKAEENR